MMQLEGVDALVAPGRAIRNETLAKMAGVPFRGPAPLAPKPQPAPPAEAGRRSVVAQPISVMDRGRKTLPIIVYPAPEAVPNEACVVASLPPEVRALCLSALNTPRECAAALRALTALTPSVQSAPEIDLAAMIAAGEPATCDVHDAFFNIGRSGHDHPAQIVIAVFQARLALWDDLAETPSSLSDSDLALLDLGLHATLSALLGPPSPSAEAPPRDLTAPRRLDAVPRRWIRGHQIFTALSQGLIFAVNGLEAATRASDTAARGAAADLMATALDACGRALEFTGDFRADLYDDLIRTHMSPPYQPEGFSGLLSSDHRELVFRLKAARPAMDTLRAEDPRRHAKVVDALAGVYDRHKHVCAKFVGAQRASLLMAEESGRSGVDQLERFKVNRLRQLGPKVSEPVA